MPHNLFDSFRDLPLPSGCKGKHYSLAALEKAGLGRVSRLPHGKGDVAIPWHTLTT